MRAYDEKRSAFLDADGHLNESNEKHRNASVDDYATIYAHGKIWEEWMEAMDAMKQTAREMPQGRVGRGARAVRQSMAEMARKLI